MVSQLSLLLEFSHKSEAIDWGLVKVWGAAAQHLLPRRIAQHAGERLIAVEDCSFQSCPVHACVIAFKKQPIAFFTFTNGVLSLLALCNVTNNGDDCVGVVYVNQVRGEQSRTDFSGPHAKLHFCIPHRCMLAQASDKSGSVLRLDPEVEIRRGSSYRLFPRVSR